jgi:branched-chain amino acid aminotransferase
MSALEFAQSTVAYVDGEYTQAQEATVSIFDRGLLYGDGIYETLLARDGRVFRLDKHLERLSASAIGIRLDLPVPRNKLRDIVLETVRRNQLSDAYIRIVVTRGVGFPNLDSRTVTSPPTLIVIAHGQEQPSAVTKSYSRNGIKLRVVSIRKTPSVCLSAQVKSLNYLNQVLARLEAVETGAGEGLLLDIQGLVAEGAGDNIFAVHGDTLVSPTLHNILLGITRQAVIDLARPAGYAVVERDMTVHDLLTADEVFLCSTYGGILPVAELNGQRIGDVAPGSVTEDLRERYERLLVEEGEAIYPDGEFSTDDPKPLPTMSADMRPS